MNKRTTIYINSQIADAINGRPSVSRRLGVICDRYAEIVRRARIKQRFTEAELNALRDACSSTMFETARLIDGAVLADFHDSLLDGAADKWGVDQEAVISKLRELSYAEQVALVEDIESFWLSRSPTQPQR